MKSANGYNISPARMSAFKVCRSCFFNRSFSSVELEKEFTANKLSKLDRNLTTAIVLGVIQNYKICDLCISEFSTISFSKISKNVLIILRIAVYQILFLDKIPSSAAVNDAVNMCKALSEDRSAGFVNAVLRKISSKCSLSDILPQVKDLSVLYSFDKWFCDRIISRYGKERAKNLFKAFNSIPPVCLQINTLKTSPDSFKTLLDSNNIAFSEDKYFDSCVYISGMSVYEIPGYKDGLFYVQDIASKYAAIISGAKSGDSVLDACASPGGKSVAMALLMGDSGKIISCDINSKKTALIEDTVSRLGLKSISAYVGDARVCNKEFLSAFDVVYADVPCSGFGVVHKKPEIRFKSEAEINTLPDIQYDILKNVAAYVKPGGTLMYSTCTIFEEENENVVRRFLAENPDFSFVDYKINMAVSEDGCFNFLPDIYESDGFFIAKMTRLF